MHRTHTHPLLNIFTEYLKYYFKYKYKNIYNNELLYEKAMTEHNGVALLRDINDVNNTWFERCITNQTDLIKVLKDYNCNIIHSEKMTLFEKFCNLSYKKYIIIEAGASLPNLYFIEKLNNTKIIILCGENMYNFHGIYEDQVRYYFKDVYVSVGNMTHSEEEKSNAYVNRPFIANIQNILDIISINV
jgi:hypothetical protein